MRKLTVLNAIACACTLAVSSAVMADARHQSSHPASNQTSKMTNHTNETNMTNHTNENNNGMHKSTVSDSDITARVNKKIATEPTLKNVHILVLTRDGVVVLTGNLNTDTEASRAIEIAQGTDGVQNVDTKQLNVKESHQPMADTLITGKVKGMFIREKLFGNEDVPITGISVETKDGVVYLSGSVSNQVEADNAMKISKSVSDVKDVKSTLKVEKTDHSEHSEKNNKVEKSH